MMLDEIDALFTEKTGETSPKLNVRLDVEDCESISGVEFERVSFYTRTNLSPDALEEAISGIPGCRELYHFEYDVSTGEGGFITICGVPKSSEYDVDFPT